MHARTHARINIMQFNKISKSFNTTEKSYFKNPKYEILCFLFRYSHKGRQPEMSMNYIMWDMEQDNPDSDMEQSKLNPDSDKEQSICDLGSDMEQSKLDLESEMEERKCPDLDMVRIKTFLKCCS